MATIAQIQSAAAAKRTDAPRISFTANTPAPTSSFTSSAIITPGKGADILWQSAKYTDASWTSYGSDAISKMNASGSNITGVRPSVSTILPSTPSTPTPLPIWTGKPTVARPIVVDTNSDMIPSDTTGMDDEERKRIKEQNKARLLDIKAKRDSAVKVVRYVDNSDWSTTNFLSDGTTSTVRYKKNANGSLTPYEVWDTYDKTTLEWSLLSKQEESGKLQKSDIELEKRAQQDALKPMQDLIAEYDSQSTQMKNEADAYEKDQNDLMQQYEGNRLNQVRGQLMSALASRGVDISKLTPEQILQLSWDVWSKAFTDVFQAKEKTKANIDARRRDATSKIMALRQQKILTDQQARQKSAEIDAYANSQKRAVDDSYSKMFYNVMTTADQNKKAEQQTALANLLAVAKDAWLSGSALASVAKIANTSNSSPEALRAFYTSLANPSSLISQKIATAESDAKKSAIAQAALKQYEAETDRLKAEAAMKSAGRVSYNPYAYSPPTWVVPWYAIQNPQ